MIYSVALSYRNKNSVFFEKSTLFLRVDLTEYKQNIKQ